jgi:2-methylaconitate cis-trans-isomerase PrpF
MAGTGATCLAAASRIPGSVAQRAVTETETPILRIGHPMGVMDVLVSVNRRDGETQFSTLGFARTARRLMAGIAYLPGETP